MTRPDGLLGLAVRAQRAVLGAHAVQRSLRRRQAVLILLADDAGTSLTRKVMALGRQAQVPVVSAGPAATLGRQVGRERLSVVAFEDEGFARSWRAQHGQEEVQGLPSPPPAGDMTQARGGASQGFRSNRGDVDE